MALRYSHVLHRWPQLGDIYVGDIILRGLFFLHLI